MFRLAVEAPAGIAPATWTASCSSVPVPAVVVAPVLRPSYRRIQSEVAAPLSVIGTSKRAQPFVNPADQPRPMVPPRQSRSQIEASLTAAAWVVVWERVAG